MVCDSSHYSFNVMTCVSKWEVACGFFLSLKAILSPETKKLFYNTLSNCHEVGATNWASLGSCMLTFFIPHVPQVFLFQQGFCVTEKELFCFLDLVILCFKISLLAPFPSGSCSGHKNYQITLLIFKIANLYCASISINKKRDRFTLFHLHFQSLCKLFSTIDQS